MLFFSDRGKVYALRAYQIPEADRAAKGTFVSNLISIGERERITAALPVPRELLTAASMSGNGDEEQVEENDAAEELTSRRTSAKALKALMELMELMERKTMGLVWARLTTPPTTTASTSLSPIPRSPIPNLQTPVSPPCLASPCALATAGSSA